MSIQLSFYESRSSSSNTQVTDSLAYVLSAKKLSFKCSSTTPFISDSVLPFSDPQSISFNSTSFSIACPLSNRSFSDPEQHSTTSPLASFAPSSPDSTTFSDISSFNDESHLINSSGPGSNFFSSNDLYFNQSRNSSFASSSCLSSFSCFSNANDDHPLMYDDMETDQEESFPEVSKSVVLQKKISQKDFEKQPQKSNKNLISSLTKSLKFFSRTLVSNPSVSRTLELNYSNLNSNSASYENSSPVPLKTFKVENTPLIENWDATTMEFVNPEMLANGCPASGNQRSARASPLFLRMYAIGNSSQQKNLIPNIFDIDESYEEEIQEENDFFYEEDDIIEQLDDTENSSSNQYTYYKLGMKAKLKLYDNIKLQPRSDSPSDNSLRKVKYIKDTLFHQNNSQSSAGAALGTIGKSLVELSDQDFFQTNPVVPWISYDDIVSLNSSRKQYVLNTHGILKSEHSLQKNSTDIMKRNKSHVQFTVKGYVNPRWVSSP